MNRIRCGEKGRYRLRYKQDRKREKNDKGVREKKGIRQIEKDRDRKRKREMQKILFWVIDILQISQKFYQIVLPLFATLEKTMDMKQKREGERKNYLNFEGSS